MIRALNGQGFNSEDIRGFKPRNPVNLVKAVSARRSERIADDGVAPMADFVLEKPGTRPLVTYLGCARRARLQPQPYTGSRRGVEVRRDRPTDCGVSRRVSEML